MYWLGLLTGQALISNLCKFVIIKKVKSKMSGSMLALAVGEWLRAEGPRQSVWWLTLSEMLSLPPCSSFNLLITPDSHNALAVSRFPSFLPVQMSSFQSVLVTYFSNGEFC